MAERKIDISRIQETHFDANDIVKINNYNIYFRHEQNQEQANKEQHKISKEA